MAQFRYYISNRILWHLTAYQRMIAMFLIPLLCICVVLAVSLFVATKNWIYLLSDGGSISGIVLAIRYLHTNQYLGAVSSWNATCDQIQSVQNIWHIAPAQRVDLITYLFTQRGYTVTAYQEDVSSGYIGTILQLMFGKYNTSCAWIPLLPMGTIPFNVLRQIVSRYGNIGSEIFVITPGTFDLPARMWAQKQSCIRLVDGATLVQWCEIVAEKRHNPFATTHASVDMFQHTLYTRVADRA